MNLILFEKEQAIRVVKALGFDVTSTGDVVSKEGEKVTCHACGDPISISNLGNVMPSSKQLFCDDPTCFAGWIAEHLD